MRLYNFLSNLAVVLIFSGIIFAIFTAIVRLPLPGILSVILIISGIFLGGFCGRRLEIIKWNRGFCLRCGKPWKRFDTDSTGARGYKDKNGHVLWIAWDIDKIYPKEK